MRTESAFINIHLCYKVVESNVNTLMTQRENQRYNFMGGNVEGED